MHGHTSIAAIGLAGFGPGMLPDPTFGGPARHWS
jgi:hypothetical protein